jgi:hypothetical protein
MKTTFKKYPTREIIIYRSPSGDVKMDVKLENETFWMTQAQLAELYGTTKQNISLHVQNIFSDGELIKSATVKDFLTVQNEGGREVKRKIDYYSLDVIIAVGYRVNSRTATQFRIWATERLKEYIIKGFTMDDERLRELGGGNYWQELLGRIRDIRSSEKALYRQVLDLYALAIDYDPRSDAARKFFKIVQNKLHYATHGQTAAEVIFDRACSDSDFMGLKTFTGSQPTLRDTEIAKNYLDEHELKILGNLVSGYFDLAEVYARQHQKMTMQDYATHLDRILTANGDKLLDGAGKVAHQQAIKKAHSEYRKYQQRVLTDVEQDYLASIQAVSKKIKEQK